MVSFHLTSAILFGEILYAKVQRASGRQVSLSLTVPGYSSFDNLKFTIMHSRIFQISTEPIDKENYLNEDTLQQGDGSFYDYCSEIDEEDRKEDIANLVNHALPKGMFELISDDTMRYNGGIEQWKEEYVANIKKRANALTADNMLEWGSTYYLKQAVENPLDVAYHFYLDGDGCSLLPNSPLRLWSLFVGLNRERYIPVLRV